ncbi:MAG TPA: threonine/serine exporter family protein [Bacteroidales bacterium]|nr:threonine/serine exporter family protein [Bacteroidales bacterium]
MEADRTIRIDEAGVLLLEIGALLMSSGASSNRVRLTIDRVAQSFDLETEMLITNRALMLTVTDQENKEFFSKVKRTSPHGVNFRLVSGISRMSWRVVDEKWEITRIWDELDRLKSLPHYPRMIVLTMVALAGASFCRLFGGSWTEMIIAFVATITGLFVRQETVKMQFNPYVCVFFASLTASLIAGLGMKLGWGESPENAFATSVLFLIPGVPLINTFTDIIDGNVLNGIVRLINSLMIAFCIALGLLGAMLIYQLKM